MQNSNVMSWNLNLKSNYISHILQKKRIHRQENHLIQISLYFENVVIDWPQNEVSYMFLTNNIHRKCFTEAKQKSDQYNIDVAHFIILAWTNKLH